MASPQTAPSTTASHLAGSIGYGVWIALASSALWYLVTRMDASVQAGAVAWSVCGAVGAVLAWFFLVPRQGAASYGLAIVIGLLTSLLGTLGMWSHNSFLAESENAVALEILLSKLAAPSVLISVFACLFYVMIYNERRQGGEDQDPDLPA